MGFASSYLTGVQARVLNEQAKDAKRRAEQQKEREAFAEEIGLPAWVASSKPDVIDLIAMEMTRDPSAYMEPTQIPEFAVSGGPLNPSVGSMSQTKNVMGALPQEIIDLIMVGQTPEQRANAGQLTAKAGLDQQKTDFLKTTLGGQSLGATPPSMGGLPPSPAGMFDMSDPRVLMALDIAGAPLPQMMDAQKRQRPQIEPSTTVPGGQDLVTYDAFGKEVSRKPVPRVIKTQPGTTYAGGKEQNVTLTESGTIAQKVNGEWTDTGIYPEPTPKAGQFTTREVTNADGSVDEITHVAGDPKNVTNVVRKKPPTVDIPIGERAIGLELPDGSPVPANWSLAKVAASGAKPKKDLAADGATKFTMATSGKKNLDEFEASGLMKSGTVEFALHEGNRLAGRGGPLTAWDTAAEYAIRTISGAAISKEEMARQAKEQYPMNSLMTPAERERSFRRLKEFFDLNIKVYDTSGAKQREIGTAQPRYEYVPGRGLVPK